MLERSPVQLGNSYRIDNIPHSFNNARCRGGAGRHALPSRFQWSSAIQHPDAAFVCDPACRESRPCPLTPSPTATPKSLDCTAEAAERTKETAVRTSVAAQRTEASADRRTELAANRAVLAADCTYAALVRKPASRDYSMHPADLARALEERGFESVWAPEHSHIPLSRKTPFPGGGDLPSSITM
jgi:hypothetical protein